ncbi:MAG: hypothetical protein M5U28_48245 [Sandaracinaceae bacterium]|nr:hypothetical protein [Sandaracinaceae bacterium]
MTTHGSFRIGISVVTLADTIGACLYAEAPTVSPAWARAVASSFLRALAEVARGADPIFTT